MSKSQDQSLDEHAVFLPLTEFHPEFLHCERERHALECLMSAGPEAFYARLSVERLGPFLSPEEVNQISAWCKDYHVSQLQLEEDHKEQEGSSTLFSACYFPSQSDTPAPCLELGWPEGVDTWLGRGTATVHTAPPAEGQPPIREIIRRHLQDACKVIAIVTDRLTDGAVIGDLHRAASRGVPVYIILNQRSIQENFTPNRLRHPNMRVRVLGGKTFCSRESKMVVGEMKNNFVLVDLETVIQGSYSLTWTDAHLHRQLVTVLRGPVVESFDREFRILFAASLPVPDTSKATRHPVDGAFLRNECLDLQRPMRPLLLDPVTSPPPLSPPDSPVDSFLDWETLGVLQRRRYIPESPVHQHDMPGMMDEAVQNVKHSNKRTPIVDEYDHIKNEFLNEPRACPDTTSEKNNLHDKQECFNNASLSSTGSRNSIEMEIHQRVQPKLERVYNRQLAREDSSKANDRMTVKPPWEHWSNSRQEPEGVSFSQRRDHQWSESLLQETMDINIPGSTSRADSPSRRALILKVPQKESFSSLSDIMRRLQPQQSSTTQHRRDAKTTVSELSRSMLELSARNSDTTHDERRPPVPRLRASCFDPDRMTPAISLMRKRNEEVKSGMLRTSKTFMPILRPRSTSFGLQLDWRRPQSDNEGGRKEIE